MSRKTKLQEIASTIKVSKRADKTINPLWRKPGYVMGLRELRELFSTIEFDPPKYPPRGLLWRRRLNFTKAAWSPSKF